MFFSMVCILILWIISEIVLILNSGLVYKMVNISQVSFVLEVLLCILGYTNLIIAVRKIVSEMATANNIHIDGDF